LVRQLDSLDDVTHGRPWAPCPLDAYAWCGRYHAQWAATLLNPLHRILYMRNVGGLVLDTSLVTLHCAYPGE
jgi:hypothetical protein